MHSESLAEKTTLDDPELSDAAPVSVSDVNNLSAFSNGAFPSEVGFIDIYDLDVVSKLPEEPPTSFIAAYARGDWVPNSIPPMPLGFQGIIGDGSDATTAGVLISPKRLSPPAILESVEEAYRSYLEETRSQISPITTHSSASQTPLSDGIQNIFEQEFREATLASSPSHGESPEPTISISTRTPPSSSEVSCISPSSLSAASQRRYEMIGYLEPPMPRNEELRRNALRRYQPYHTGIDPDLNRILRLGKLMFSVDATAISLVDSDFVHVTGFNSEPVIIHRGQSTCSHTILVDVPGEPMVVQDTREDWRFRNNHTIVRDWGVTFYAGQPLRTSDGFNIGTVCVIDSQPRTKFTQHERDQLKELADMVMHELEAQSSQREAAFRESLHSSVEGFNRAINTGNHTGQQILSMMIESIESALTIEGVLCLDVRPCKGSLAKMGQNPLGKAISIPILAASEHAMKNIKEITIESETLLKALNDQNGELSHTHGSPTPEILSRILPPRVGAAATLITRGSKEPFMVIIAYSSKKCPHFVSPPPIMAYFRSMGTIVCTVQEKQTLSLADKAKIDFIANISHELRTPLHGVIASCDLLSETNLCDAQESLLETAKSCASSLAETINHVLDFTKANAMRSGAVLELVDLAQLVEETMISCWLGRTVRPHTDGIGGIYTAGSQTLRRKFISPDFVEPLIDIEPIENWSVMTDKSGLRRVLLNLIGNSMKFTRGGYVKVSLHRGPSIDPERMAVELVVEDTGCGMSEAFVRDKLFHPFSQEAPLAQGIGLGLAIVRSILKSPGIDGTIDVHTKVNIGTRMTIRLQPPTANDLRSWTRSPSQSLTRLPSFAMCGFHAEHRGSGMLASGIRRGLRHWYGTIVEVDVKEAGLLIVDGDSIDISKLDALGANRPMILLLCSSPVDSVVFKATQDYSGNNRLCTVVVKPIGPHALSKALSALVGGRNSTPSSPLQHSLPVLPPTSQPLPPTAQERPMRPQSNANMSRLRVLVIEDNLVNRKVLTAFLKKRNCYFDEAGDGIEGVQRFQESKGAPYHVCLMDLQMPRKDGFEAAREIRQLEAERDIPLFDGTAIQKTKIFALTGLASAEDRKKADEIGFDGYLVKPITFKALWERLQQVVDDLP